ncbi:hypothetical protein OPQ81_011383 [Rhizoctonia solani]|nr:hypothetical protein OPQ81_011383 [Rhizoctonia solani]
MAEVARISLDHMPNEVIIHILRYCSFRFILSYAMTSRRGYHLVKNSAILQLHIELEVAGLEIIESMNDATSPSLLQDVIRYQNAWANMKFGPAAELPMPKDRILLWELREGSFISAYSTSPGRKLADAIQVVPLDTQTLPKPMKFGLTFNEFTLDLSQKLVVLAVVDVPRQDRVRLLLRSSETNLFHPLAQQPIILVQLEFPILHKKASSITLEVMDDILVAKFADIRSLAYEILIWDWKTTTLLNRICSPAGVCDLGFLDRQTLILYHAGPSDGSTALRTSSLLVYRHFRSPISSDTIRSGTHIVASNYRSLNYTFAFGFPKVHATMAILPPALALRSDPVPGRLVHKTEHAKFASTRAGTLGLIFPLSYNSQIEPQDVTYRIFVSTSRLFDLMADDPETKTFQWTAWGEQATRWFSDDSQQEDWISWVSGSRYLRTSPGVRYGSLTLSVVDFCPFGVKRHSQPHPHQIVPLTQPLRGRNANIDQRWARTIRDWWNSPDWSSSDDRVFVDTPRLEKRNDGTARRYKSLADRKWPYNWQGF